MSSGDAEGLGAAWHTVFPLIERATEDRQRPNWVLTEKLRADVDAVSVVGGNVRTVPLGIQRVAGEELS